MNNLRDSFSFVIAFVVSLFIITSCNEFELEPAIETNNNVYRTNFHPELDVVVREDVPLQGFYKDIFMDAGVYLSTRNTLAAATYLGYSLESVSCTDISDTLWQNSIIAGDENDLNGRLLYPDGQPRYRMLFVCGGNSQRHGQSLRYACLDNMRDFVTHGGSYVGTCAGAFFASCGYDTKKDYPYYLHLWPGMMNHTGLKQMYTGLFVDLGSPLLSYYDFGGDNYVADVRQNEGGYPADWPSGTELLARYDYPDQKSVHGQPAAWSYKYNQWTGRVIMEGSHPEEVNSGERRDFTAAMLSYAIDGVGNTYVKGQLKNGEPWIMDKGTLDADPLHTKIGDLQYHHFVVNIPNEAENISFTLTSPVDCDMQLSLCSDTYAYDDVANYRTTVSGSTQHLFFETLDEGLWYLAVRCLTTVTSRNISLGQEYTDHIDVLNGVPYTIIVSWE